MIFSTVRNLEEDREVELLIRKPWQPLIDLVLAARPFDACYIGTSAYHSTVEEKVFQSRSY